MMKNTDGSVLKFVSWNCKELNFLVKCSRVLQHLQRLGGHVIFLQETHFKPPFIRELRVGGLVRLITLHSIPNLEVLQFYYINQFHSYVLV